MDTPLKPISKARLPHLPSCMQSMESVTHAYIFAYLCNLSILNIKIQSSPFLNFKFNCQNLHFQSLVSQNPFLISKSFYFIMLCFFSSPIPKSIFKIQDFNLISETPISS